MVTLCHVPTATVQGLALAITPKCPQQKTPSPLNAYHTLSCAGPSIYFLASLPGPPR